MVAHQNQKLLLQLAASGPIYTSGRSEDEPAAAEGQRFTAELQRAPPFRMVGGCDGTPSLWTALGETPGLLPLYDTPMAGQLSAPKSSFPWGL